MKVTVAIPCHNEAATVAATIEGFRRSLPSAEIVVCDNASSDDTGAIAGVAGARVMREERKGKGEAVRRLFAELEADIYVLTDGDLTYDPDAAPEMVRQLIAENLDMVVSTRLASRADGLFRPGHYHGNRLFSAVLSWFFCADLSDVLSGYRVMSRRFVKSFPAASRGFEIESELTVFALEQRCKIKEVPSAYTGRPFGSDSKLSTFSDGTRIVKMVALLYRDVRPLQFFGVLAALLAVSALSMFYPILHTYVEAGMVPRFPTLIVLTAMLVLSVVFITCGIILDGIANSRRAVQRMAYMAYPGPHATASDIDDGCGH